MNKKVNRIKKQPQLGLNNFQGVAQADEDIRLDAWRDINPISPSACHYVAPDNFPLGTNGKKNQKARVENVAGLKARTMNWDVQKQSSYGMHGGHSRNHKP